MDKETAIKKIAQILRTDRAMLGRVISQLEKVTGKQGVIEDIVQENNAEILEAMDSLELSPKASAAEVYDALISKLEADDASLFELFKRPDYSKPEGYKTVLGFAKEISGVQTGFFLKWEKAREFILKQPPPKILQALGYSSAEELLEKEDIVEIYAALRFLEGAEWLNKVFFKQYENLTPYDFEERQIEVRVISPKWVKATEQFIKKKYHNLSHLKELGAIFVIPWTLGVSGETMRMFSLLLHYMHEVDFYSKLFKNFSEDPKTFSANLISSLRGDVIETRPDSENVWLIVQRYLAKDDENDWRLFWPHINPEARHWQKAEMDLVRLGGRFGITGLGFWHNLDWVGDYFKTEVGIDVLVSFDLIDTAMSAVKEKELAKYLYHHQEALWNKIFSSFFGQEGMDSLMETRFIKGYIDVEKLI
jgi:hypothetical protein